MRYVRASTAVNANRYDNMHRIPPLPSPARYYNPPSTEAYCAARSQTACELALTHEQGQHHEAELVHVVRLRALR